MRLRGAPFVLTLCATQAAVGDFAPTASTTSATLLSVWVTEASSAGLCLPDCQ